MKTNCPMCDNLENRQFMVELERDTCFYCGAPLDPELTKVLQGEGNANV